MEHVPILVTQSLVGSDSSEYNLSYHGVAIIIFPPPQEMSLLCHSAVGRASSTPTLDVFITLLSLGWQGYHRLIQERKVWSDIALKVYISSTVLAGELSISEGEGGESGQEIRRKGVSHATQPHLYR